MARYRKRPVVVEAILVADALRCATRAWDQLPSWVRDAYEAGGILFLSDSVSIRTLEGTMRGEPSDWLIRGVQGELYACKPDIFKATYEAVADAPTR